MTSEMSNLKKYRETNKVVFLYLYIITREKDRTYYIPQGGLESKQHSRSWSCSIGKWVMSAIVLDWDEYKEKEIGLWKEEKEQEEEEEELRRE